MGTANKNNITKQQDVNRKLTSNEVDLNFQELINNIEDVEAIENNFNEQAEAIQQVRTDLAGEEGVALVGNAQDKRELQAADSEYGIGVEVTRRNQTIWKDGIPYRPNATLELPYTTTGDWGEEESLFVSVGDAVLRQELANPDMGAEMVWLTAPNGERLSSKTALDRLIGTQGNLTSLKNSNNSLQELINENPGVSVDEEEIIPARIEVLEPSKKIVSSTAQRVYQPEGKTGVLAVLAPANSVSISGVSFEQFKMSPPGTGTGNDHPLVNAAGVKYTELISNKLNGEIGFSFGFGSASLPDRRSQFGLMAFNVGTDIWGMYLENIGSSYNRLIGNVLDSETKGNSHAIRLSGYDKIENPSEATHAPCHGIVGTANVMRNATYGVSYQNSSKYSNINGTHFTEMRSAVHTTPGTVVGNNPTLHRLDFTANKIEKAIYNVGMNHSKFSFHVDGSNFANTIPGAGSYGVEELNTYFGVGMNHYEGLIKNAAMSGFIGRFSHTLYNLQISNVTGVGAVINGNYGNGSITVNNTSGDGVLVGGNGNNLSLVVTNVGGVTAVGVAGSGNVLNIVTDGKVTVSGTGNKISGRIDGTIIKGTGNDFSGVIGFSGGGYKYETLDENGKISFDVDKHASAAIVSASALISYNPSGIQTRLVGVSGSTLTFQFLDSSGNPLGAVAREFLYSWRAV